MHFDTDSFLIGVDSFASVTMAMRPEQFEDLIHYAGQSMQGIEGGLAIKGHGTFIFNIEDDEGKVHQIKIADSMYVPDLKFCLLSPQHWAQRPTTALEEQGWKLMPTASFSSGATEVIGARFLTVAT